MLIILSWVGFWINREATGDRIALGKEGGGGGLGWIWGGAGGLGTPTHLYPELGQILDQQRGDGRPHSTG